MYIVVLLRITPKLDIAQMSLSSRMGKQGTMPPYIEYYSAMKRKELQKTWNSKGEFQVICNESSQAQRPQAIDCLYTLLGKEKLQGENHCHL